MEEKSEWRRNAEEVKQRDRVDIITTTLRKKKEKHMIMATI